MNTASLICPVCKGRFTQEGRSIICQNAHSFDIAKAGYVNLLPPKGAKIHGDNKEMIVARRDFLNLGYYEKMRDTLAQTVSNTIGINAVIVDAGCGEGYYTQRIEEIAKPSEFYAIDISKDALIYAGKRKMQATLAAASVYSMPISDSIADGVISVFSPFAKDEFLRILKPHGYLFMVIPKAKHLFGLKAAIYDKPYENVVAPYGIDGFCLTDKCDVCTMAHLKDQSEIDALFKMTPYYYRTKPSDKEKAANLKVLDTEIEFEILVYRKI